MNMNNPLVSIIIPNYNHARFLNRRIESILMQSYSNFEIIILDDCSSDNSIEIINQYKEHPKVSHILINDTNSGSTFKQWEKGFELAKGDLIWIAESDDSCEPDILESLVKEFINDNHCVLAFCKSIKIDSDDNIIGEAGMGKDLHACGKSFFNHYLYRYCYINNASSAVFKKEMLHYVDQRYKNFKGSGDWILWIEISRFGNVAYVNKPLNYFRIHGTNTTTIQLRSGKNEAEAIEVYKFMKDKAYIGYLKELRTRIAHIYSIKYGKLRNVLNNDTRQKLLKGWRTNIVINLITALVYLFQNFSGIKLIKR